MRRQALVVGINRYPSSAAKHLQRLASDAEAIAQLLDKATGSVRRLPEVHQELWSLSPFIPKNRFSPVAV